MRRAPERIDTAVIGGGPAGSMAGLWLARAGCDVVLLEREPAAHAKVCGEFLSAEAVAYLVDAGLDPHALGAAAIDRVRLCVGRRSVEAALPFPALSLSRNVLDETLLKRAEAEGCAVRRGACVEKLTECADGWQIELRGRDSFHARSVFLATGKHDVPGWKRGRGTQADLVGFKLHWRLQASQTQALRGAMELFLFAGGYGGLSLVENDTANLCFVIRQTQLRALGGWTPLIENIRRVNERLRTRLHGAEPLRTKPLAISPIPYGYIAEQTNGVWCVGDQAAVIPSFTGDGMSIALHSGALAAQMFLEGKGVEEFYATLGAQLRPGMRLATGLSKAMVSSAGRQLAPAGLAMIPGAMRWIARATRIPERALRTALDPGRHRIATTLPAS